MVIVTVAVALFLVLGTPLDLARVRGHIEEVASAKLDRTVRIAGPILLLPTLPLTVQVTGLTIANPRGWPDLKEGPAPELLHVGSVRVQIEALALLARQLDIGEISIDRLQVNLATTPDGATNWVRGATSADNEGRRALRVVELGKLSVRDATIVYRDGASDTTHRINLLEISGSAKADEPLQMLVRTAVRGVPYDLTLRGGSLAALYEPQEPWPLELSSTTEGVTATLIGQLGDPLRGRGMDLKFVMEGTSIDHLEQLAGRELPPIGVHRIEFRILEEEGTFRFGELEAVVGRTAFTGDVAVDLSGERPAFSGRLDVATLDVTPFDMMSDVERETNDRHPSESPDAPVAPDLPVALDLDEPPFDPGLLRKLDAEVELTVAELIGAASEVRDASLAMTVDEGVLTATLGLAIAGVPIAGRLEVGAEDEALRIEAALQAAESDIGDAARVIYGSDQIEGRFEHAEASITMRGRTLRALVDSLGCELLLEDVVLSYGQEAGGPPVGFALETMDVALPAGRPLEVRAEGTLIDEPFSLELASGTASELLLGQRWPIEVSAQGAGAVLHVQGLAGHEVQDGMDFSLSAERIGDLESWLGVSGDADLAFGATGQLRVDWPSLAVQGLNARIGHSSLRGELGVRATMESPFVHLTVRSELLDVEELGSLYESEAARGDPAPEVTDSLAGIDKPVLPRGIRLDDADVDLAIARVHTTAFDIADVSLVGRIRDGWVDDAPFQATIAGATFSGHAAIDMRHEVPMTVVTVATEEIDIGVLLSELDLVSGLEARAGRLEVDVHVEGGTPHEMGERSWLSASLVDAVWTLRDESTGDRLPIRVPQGTLAAPAGEPMVLTLNGFIEQTPVQIAIRTEPLAAFVHHFDQLPLALTAELAGARLELDAVVDLPIDRADLHFEMSLVGDRMSGFDDLLDTSLPPWGPYALRGRFDFQPASYELSDVDLQIGESDLRGDLRLEMTGVRPRLLVDLTTSRLQIDDFRVFGWSPLGEATAGESLQGVEAESGAEMADEVLAAADGPHAMMSPAVMRNLDAQVSLTVEEVLSGRDHLGSGTLAAALEDGRFSIFPLILNVPGGSVDAAFSYQPTDTEVLVEAEAKIAQLDYGVLARRVDPETDLAGRINVDLALHSRTTKVADTMASASGHLDVAVWPDDLDAGEFDLWAVNLLWVLIPILDSTEGSRINCVIGRFRVEDGIMAPEAILIDSTNNQASGDGEVNFKTETVDLQLESKSKQPQMFSTAPPIQVKGHFSDFGAGVSTAQLMGTAVRMATSPLVVPFQWVFSEQPAPDGRAACAEAWGRSPAG